MAARAAKADLIPARGFMDKFPKSGNNVPVGLYKLPYMSWSSKNKPVPLPES
jgi:hypothetical protein